MTATQVLLHLAGEVALLLWGIHMVQSGIMRAFGTGLRRWMETRLSNRVAAFLAGIGVTAAIQSSTATAMMVTSFTTAGAVTLGPAIAVMLGANVGTALIVQVLSFDITMVFPVLIVLGILLFRRGQRTRLRDIGRASIGLGLMLLSLHLLTVTMEPVESLPALKDLLHAVSADPVINLLVAAVLTWAAHSSVAAMLFIMSLASTGAIGPDAALAMVLGANLGSAVNPLLESGTTGGNAARLRVPLANLGNRLVGVALALPLLGIFAQTLTDRAGLEGAQLAAVFHMLFNLVLSLLFLPALYPLARLTERLLPEKANPADPATPLYLDDSAPPIPPIALANAAREVLRMADVVEDMLRGSEAAFRHTDRDRAAAISRMDDVLDKLHAALHRYLAGIGHEGMPASDLQRMSEIMRFAINLEHIGDILDKNLMELALKRIRLQIGLPAQEMDEISALHDRLLTHLRLSVAVFMSADLASARQLVAEKEQFRDVEAAITERYMQRIREGDASCVERSVLELDIVRDLKRLDAHIAAIAYPLLEQSGDLRTTRLANRAA